MANQAQIRILAVDDHALLRKDQRSKATSNRNAGGVEP